MLYICTKIHENILQGIKITNDSIFIGNISKGQNSTKYRWSYASFSLSHLLKMVYICTNFQENILNCIRVMSGHKQFTDGQTDGRMPRYNTTGVLCSNQFCPLAIALLVVY